MRKYFICLLNIFLILKTASAFAEVFTQEILERALQTAAEFTADDLTVKRRAYDFDYDKQSERFVASPELVEKIKSFGNDEDGEITFREQYLDSHITRFDLVKKGDGVVDYIQIYRIPQLSLSKNPSGFVQFTGYFYRFNGDNEKVLLGKNMENPEGVMFQAKFEWKPASTRSRADHLRQFYINRIDVGTGFDTRSGIGTRAVRDLIRFVEDNALADIITIDARSGGSRGLALKLGFTVVPVSNEGKYIAPIASDNREKYNFYKIISAKGRRVIEQILQARAQQ